MDKTYLQWARDNERAALLPNALLEPRHPHDGVGAALVIRGALYFEKAYDPAVRAAVVECVEEYEQSAPDRLTYLWHNGRAAQPFKRAKPMRALAASLKENDRFDFDYLSGEHATDASFYEFHVFGMRGWEEKMGTRGVNAIDFSWPVLAVQENPQAFARLFYNFARRLNALHGQAGFAVNLSPTGRPENEATEYWISRMMPGADVGYPGDNAVRDLKGQIKTVNWLTAISHPMFDALGGVSGLRSELPPAWYGLYDYGAGILIQAGVKPESGAAEADDQLPAPPAAYVVLDRALRGIHANTLDVLQTGTVNGDSPVYNTVAATQAWLRRFEVPDDALLRAKAALLDTPPIAAADGLPNKL